MPAGPPALETCLWSVPNEETEPQRGSVVTATEVQLLPFCRMWQ